MTSARRKFFISCAAAFEHVDAVRAAVKEICSEYFDLPGNAESVMDFCLIVTELMNNAVEHSAADVLEAEIVLTEQEALFRLISAGEGFDPTLAMAMPDGSRQEGLEGGYGLPLIQALADGMEYERRDNKNLVVLRKTFPHHARKEGRHGTEA